MPVCKVLEQVGEAYPCLFGDAIESEGTCKHVFMVISVNGVRSQCSGAASGCPDITGLIQGKADFEDGCTISLSS